MIADIAPILTGDGVDLVISGHNHYMEYLEAEGIPFAVIGVMGGHPDPEPTWHSQASRWFKQGTFGFLELNLEVALPELIFRDQKGSELFRKILESENN